jgi:hypothetical protein
MMNGHQHDPMALGVLLGGLQAESRRQTEIMLAFLDETHEMRRDIHDLPERIAARLPAHTEPPRRLRMIKEILQTAVPLALLAAIVAGKIALADALPLMRVALGL